MLDYQLKDRLPVHEHGYVALVDVMGSDEDIAQAARISYDYKGKTADRTLLRYLLRHRHTSPFEMAVMKFEIKLPIFVMRQWVRHRTASLNEVSARYTELPDEFFVPEKLHLQSTDNKQGRGDEEVVGAETFLSNMRYIHHKAYEEYEMWLNCGVSREIARGVLPVNIYTKIVWQMNLHNLLHFLHLRTHSHAQKEIRDYAEVIEKLVALKFPLTFEAYQDYISGSYTLSRMEVQFFREKMRNWKDPSVLEERCKNLGMAEREIKEFKEKFHV